MSRHNACPASTSKFYIGFSVGNFWIRFVMKQLYAKLNFDLNCLKSPWMMKIRYIYYAWAEESIKSSINKTEVSTGLSVCGFNSPIFTHTRNDKLVVRPEFATYLHNPHHVAPMYHEVTTNYQPTTDVDWPSWLNIFPHGETLRESVSEKYYIVYCDQKNIAFNWRTSAESQQSWSLYHHYHYPHHHHDQYHSAWHLLLTCYHVLCGWNNEGPLALYSIILHSPLITNIEHTEKLIPHHSP